VSLRLISLNVERSKHLELVVPFLEHEKPDVYCAQELHESDIARLEAAVGPCIVFAPVLRHIPDTEGKEPQVMGTAIFSRLLVRHTDIVYYRGSREHALTDVPKRIMEDLPLVIADVESNGHVFRCTTTHFTWTPKGEPDDQQRRDMDALLGTLGTLNEFVLCGDFNAPRGGEMFARLAETYRDNIPAEFAWSLDLAVHRDAAGLRSSAQRLALPGIMVDGLFSTPAYTCSGVEMKRGGSDHLAIVATIAHA
jgi:endonuclease/exonuclease/phosphatase family metal-dependent hydrolase